MAGGAVGRAQIAGPAERTCRHGRLEPPIELLGLSDTCLREDDGELVASDSAGDVGGAHDRAEAAWGLGGNGVPFEVPDAVVDDLEIVDVEDDESERALIPLRAPDFTIERLVKEAVVA